MRNRDIFIPVPTYRSVNKMYSTVLTFGLAASQNKARKCTLEDTRSLGTDGDRSPTSSGACKYLLIGANICAG